MRGMLMRDQVQMGRAYVVVGFTSRPEFHLSDRCASARAPCKAWCLVGKWQRRDARPGVGTAKLAEKAAWPRTIRWLCGE